MTTAGQQRAIQELERLSSIDPNEFELIDEPHQYENWLLATVSIRLGLIEQRAGGLDLREREQFILWIPSDFPFNRPHLTVSHERFAGFPHVTWKHSICLYQSSIEWNPSDGLYGFFDRLRLWLTRAAINDMDPIEGPLEPPHYNLDSNQKPFVIRANAPCPPGESWYGLAVLRKNQNYTELVNWMNLSEEWQTQEHLAFAVVLPNPLPMEFPTKGGNLFRELEKAGMDRKEILRDLALAALLTPEGEPLYLVVGLPMRRASDGSPRQHIAVWTVSSETAGYLKKVLPDESDSQELLNIRKDLGDAIMAIFELSNITWCKMLEDRAEIVVRRDNGTPMSWFKGKKVLILGCGALGSWTAEIIARANPRQIELVDDSLVKPGILARQNFESRHVGLNKSIALADRLSAITFGCSVVPHPDEAHKFLLNDIARFQEYDVVIDCTASNIFQSKLERDWTKFDSRTPDLISLIIDSQAKHTLCVVVPKNAPGGIWNAYLGLKLRLTSENGLPNITSAFYSTRATDGMFQPEPGCSDPTFVGSTADIFSSASNALNWAISNLQGINPGGALALSTPVHNSKYASEVMELPRFREVQVGNYRVRITPHIFTQAKAWIKQNHRSRSQQHETGGLLWGFWDDAIGGIWIFDLSGPPSDSRHDPGHFICGVKGTLEEHNRRFDQSFGLCGFVGHWHTHPNLPSYQSSVDMSSMINLVSTIGQNQKRSLMMILGSVHEMDTVGIYVYESQPLRRNHEMITVGSAQFDLDGDRT